MLTEQWGQYPKLAEQARHVFCFMLLWVFSPCASCYITCSYVWSNKQCVPPWPEEQQEKKKALESFSILVATELQKEYVSHSEMSLKLNPKSTCIRIILDVCSNFRLTSCIPDHRSGSLGVSPWCPYSGTWPGDSYGCYLRLGKCLNKNLRSRQEGPYSDPAG